MCVLGAFSRPEFGHETGRVGLLDSRSREVTQHRKNPTKKVGNDIVEGGKPTSHHPQPREGGHTSAAGGFSTEGRRLRNVLTCDAAA